MSHGATKPSVGRILHYIPAQNEPVCWIDRSQPLCAQIIMLNADDTVNVIVWGQDGRSNHRIGVRIVGELESPPQRGYLRWMPYQRAVASGEAQPVQHA